MQLSISASVLAINSIGRSADFCEYITATEERELAGHRTRRRCRPGAAADHSGRAGIRRSRRTQITQYLALSCDRRGVERTHQCAGVLLQNVTVDILDSVTGPMIAGIVRATSRTAEQAGLDLRLRPACARVKTHGRNALLGE